jgi:hypothetical protein
MRSAIMRLLPVLLLGTILAACGTKPATTAAAPPASSAAPAGRSAIDPGTIVAIVQSAASSPPGPVVSAPLVPGLTIVCMAGRPPAERPLTDADLPALGLTRDSALALARANVAAGLRPIASAAPVVPPGEIGTIVGDYAEGGRILVHDEWAPLSQALGGHLLVAVPAQDRLLYTKGGVPGALTTLANMARAEMAKSDRPVSDVVLRWTQTGWDVVAKGSGAAPRPNS